MNETTTSYYDSLADVINEKYPQGYQVALIKNNKYESLSLKEQNYHYLAELGGIKNESFICDLGCGNGQFHDFLKSQYAYKNCGYVGVDCSEKQLKNAKEKKFGSEASFLQVNMDEFFSFEPYFDVCYFIESIGYTNNLDLLVKSISTGLKMGGKVVIKNPIKIVHDDEKDSHYKEKFSEIENEYGYTEKSLGMLPNKNDIERVFLDNGFEIERIEVPESDIMTYNSIFCSTEEFANTHTSYIEHVSKRNYEDYSPNQYLECMIFVFKKVAEVVNDTKELPFVQQRYDQYTQNEPMDKVIQRSIEERGIDIMDPLSLELYRSNPDAAAAAIKQNVAENNE